MNDILPVTRLVTNEYWQRSFDYERLEIYANNFISLILQAPFIPKSKHEKKDQQTISRPPWISLNHVGHRWSSSLFSRNIQNPFGDKSSVFMSTSTSTCETIFSQLHSWILWKFLLLDSKSLAWIFHGWGLRKICKSYLIVLITSCWLTISTVTSPQASV